jgi:hypothetical protein
MNGYECLNCAKIGDCKETDKEKALAHYCCPRWEAASAPVIAARNEALAAFGEAGLHSILTTKTKKGG